MLASIALCLIELIDHQRLTAELPGWFVVEASVCLCCTRELPSSPHRVCNWQACVNNAQRPHNVFFSWGKGAV